MNDVRMKDERDGEGNGFLNIEIEVNGTWTTLSRTWFFRGEPQEVWIQSDKVNEITLSQFTAKRAKWIKKQHKNQTHFGKHFNYTTLKRKDGDC